MSFFQSLSSPSLIYIFGSWESLDQHMNHFIPSAPNQATLKSLQGDVSVEWLLHVGVERGEMGLPGPGDGGVVGVRREVVEGREDGREVERRVEKDEREGRIEGGWRVDGVDGREEWVEVCVFGSGKEYDEFERKAGNEDGSGGGEVGWAKVLDI
ncbi:hypothetical protein CC86DRAFT_364817 [Ophiobolus disseminans]|uniref:Uncharacterized protein n=1 Tax=Ophiobolus disseminans TaxID=1469910 RepID=A0A6A7AJ89_9PLEO|nr:hypothetical protein CC86DRAFT_364817 [Ophiobolus disseminans]